MKADEFKLRLMTTVNKLVDQYFGRTTIGERFINATLKVIVKNNIGKIDSVLVFFEDENGCIDADKIIAQYAEEMGDDKISINLRDYIHDSGIKSMIPNRTLTLTKEDLYEIIGKTIEPTEEHHETEMVQQSETQQMV